MQDLFLPIKNIHMSLAMLSLAGLIIRVSWAIQGYVLLQ